MVALAGACTLGLLVAAGPLEGSGMAPEGTQAADAQPAMEPSTSCPQQFGSFGVGHWPPACWRPYGPSSPFNSKLPPSPVLTRESGSILSYMKGSGWTFTDDEEGRFVLPGEGSRPVYWSQRSDPVVRVVCRGDFSCRRGLRLRIPAAAEPQGESDGHMTVVDQSGGREYDFWRAGTPRDGTMTAEASSDIPIGENSGLGLHGNGEAASLGLLGGLIRAPELAAGRIEHALVAAVPCVQWHDVWPSPRHGTGDAVCSRGGRSGPHLGSLLQLQMSDAEIAASGAPAWQQAIMAAMAHYGIYVVDTNGAGNSAINLIAEDDQSFTSFGFPGQLSGFLQSLGSVGKLVGVPLSVARLRVVAPCVDQGRC